MTRSIVNRADLLRILQLGNQDALEELAGTLCFDPLPPMGHESTEKQPPARSVRDSEEQAAPELHTNWPAEMIDVPQWRVVTYRPRIREQPSDQVEEAPPRLEWTDRPTRLPQYPLLAAWSELLPRLRDGLEQTLHSSWLDVRQTTDRLARGEMLATFPRLPVKKWGTPVYVVMDVANHMMPFWHDQQAVFARLESIVPSYALEKVVARGPDRLRWITSDDQPHEFGEVPRGSLLLVLGDLGMLKKDGRLCRDAWLAWLRDMTDQGVRILVLTPGNPTPLAKAVGRLATVIPWQGTRTRYVDDADQRRRAAGMILALAAPLIRLEPGLLRCLRLTLPDAEDASLEAEVWQHEALQFIHPAGATIDREFAEANLLPGFLKRPDRWPAVLDIIRHWRAKCLISPEIWFEEVNGLDPSVRKLLPRSDIADAAAAWRYFRTQIGSGETPPADHDVADYLRRACDRATAALAADPELSEIYRALFRATHRPENHDRVLGYDPIESKPGELRTLSISHRGDEFRFEDMRRLEVTTMVLPPGPLATVRTTQPTLVVQEASFWKAGVPPGWASAWGWDDYGAWAEISMVDDTDGRVVVQKLRWIPPGDFLMGSPDDERGRWDDEGPQHQVTISRGFWMFDTAVTQELWQAVMEDNPSDFRGAKRPVERVSWEDCQEFLKRLAMRLPEGRWTLPTEAQWEYACRAGTTTPFSFGENITPAQVNYDGDHPYAGGAKGEFRGETVAAGSLPLNRWGLFEMHGNVWEWCADGKREYGRAAAVDPVGKAAAGANRVVRGGSWSNDAQSARSAIRYAVLPGDQVNDLGFRCALVPAEPGAEPAVASKGREAEPRPGEQQRGGAARELVRLDKLAACKVPRAVRVRVVTDVDDLEIERFTKPSWATAIARDRFGLWAEFKIEHRQTGNDIIQRLHWIPPGRFRMGSDDPEDSLWRDAKPAQDVVITQGFWLFDTQVTQALWTAILPDNPSRFEGEQRPVECVSWHNCQSFLNELSRNFADLDCVLPTEAEWEYACRAGTNTAYSCGAEITPGEAHFWSERGNEGTVDVARYPANPWGLYDMHGNVWEWCYDGVREYGTGEAVDPVGDRTSGAFRVVRGGSWRNDALHARSAIRDASLPGNQVNDLGFRCALVRRPSGRKPSEESVEPDVATEEPSGRSD